MLYIEKITDNLISAFTEDEDVAKSLNWTITKETNDVEQAYNGYWYLKGYAPVQPISEQNDAIRAKREQLYSSQIDPLHARKARKVILNDWSEANEAEYVAEVARISKEIEDENPYMDEHLNGESL